MNGYMGAILRVDLTSGRIMTIPTSHYESWVGGHGMGSAIFFDLVKDKTIDGLDPANVVTIMTSPLCGTLVPAGAGRTEVQGIGVQSYPIGWFTRSNFGGRFSTMLKQAGWDGIVIEGRAERPVWIDIRNRTVQIRDCRQLSLWGTDTRTCQERIWSYVAGKGAFGDWLRPAGGEGGQTTQRPAVLTIGPAGENLSRLACLIHDAANSSGQGGFGAVWGSKNLKAISVIGTGGVNVHDPQGLMRARLRQTEQYAFSLDNRKRKPLSTVFDAYPRPVTLWGKPAGTKRPTEGQRPQGCVGCHAGCRGRYASGVGNEAHCVGSVFYSDASSLDIQRRSSDLLNRYGVNAFEAWRGLEYLRDLNRAGVLGPGKRIDFPLSFKNYGSYEFVEQFIRMIAFRNDGRGHKSQAADDLAEGFVRAARKWGRLEGEEGDLKTGLLNFPHWGLPNHYEPRTELEWGYGTILGDRDINEHCFNTIFWDLLISRFTGSKPSATAEETVKIYTDKMIPFEGDRLMMDYGTENMYSEHIAKLVAWHRHYTRFWKQSALLCDFRWPDFVNPYAPDKVGSTGESEPAFFHAVTGRQVTFLDGMELGRRIWNLDQAIWTLQGRHRDMVHFADYIYQVPYGGPSFMPSRVNGRWDYVSISGRAIDKGKFEEFKSRFYLLEGWDPDTGYPSRGTLRSLNLGTVADELERNNKLGKG
jgi:aldehyde:ferredoxin oxidoreductase